MLALGGKPGRHEVSAWEYFFAAYPKADEGDYDGALAEIDAGLAVKPEHPPLLYHRACINARAGRLDEARTALDRALELDPELSEVGRRGRGSGAATRRRGAVGRRRGAAAPGPDPPRAGATSEHRAVPLAGERADEQLQPERERERLVRLLAAERDELVRRAAPRSTSPYVTAPIETSATSGVAVRARDRRSRAGSCPASGSPPAGCASRARRGRRQRRDEAAVGEPAHVPAEHPGREAVRRRRRRARAAAVRRAARRRPPRASGSRARRCRPSARSPARRAAAAAARPGRGRAASRASRSARGRGRACRATRRRGSASRAWRCRPRRSRAPRSAPQAARRRAAQTAAPAPSTNGIPSSAGRSRRTGG